MIHVLKNNEFWFSTNLKSLISKVVIILSMVMVLSYYLGYTSGWSSGYREGFSQIPPKEIVTVYETEPHLEFTPENLAYYINALNISFPQVVYAQAVQETGYFTSNIFLENNNLFGMKQARVRPTTARGTKRGHAYYTNWQESVVDYAMWQVAYANQFRTEQDYLMFLDGLYAEDPNYIYRLETIMNRDNLLAMFLF